MRSRELWLWLGGALLTLGTVLAATALAYLTKLKNFSLMTSPQMLLAISVFALAFASFLAAIIGWRFPQRRLRFPDLLVTVGLSMIEDVALKPHPGLTAMGVPQSPGTQKLWAWNVSLTNREPERTASIKGVSMRASVRPQIGGDMREVTWGILPLPDFESGTIRPCEFPINLEPQQTKGGHFTFDVLVPEAVDLSKSWIEMEDAQTGMWARFPTVRGTYAKESGLQILKAEKLWTIPYPG